MQVLLLLIILLPALMYVGAWVIAAGIIGAVWVNKQFTMKG